MNSTQTYFCLICDGVQLCSFVFLGFSASNKIGSGRSIILRGSPSDKSEKSLVKCVGHREVMVVIH